MRLYSYVVARDYGFAPNPFHGVCTLATCMQTIRETAKIGDWIIGTGSKEYKKRQIEGCLLYCMRVDEIIPFDEYWNDARFRIKRPIINASLKYQMGDNIYHRVNGVFRQENSHHSCEDGSLNPNNLEKDTGRTERVLIGWRFVYWGSDAAKIPCMFRDFGGIDVVKSGQGHKCRFPAEMVDAFVEWFEGLGLQGIIGAPGKFN